MITLITSLFAVANYALILFTLTPMQFFCLLVVSNILLSWYYYKSEKDLISSIITSSAIIIVFTGIGAILIEFVFYLIHSEPVRTWRYRGYVFPTENNRVKHLQRIINGELEQYVPEDFE